MQNCLGSVDISWLFEKLLQLNTTQKKYRLEAKEWGAFCI